MVLRHVKAIFVKRGKKKSGWKNKKRQEVSRFNGRSALIIYRLMQGLRHRRSLSCTTKEANIDITYNAMHMRVGLQRGCSTRRSFGATWRSAAALGHGWLPAWTGTFPGILLCLCDAMTTRQTKFPGLLCLLVFCSGPLVPVWTQNLLKKSHAGWMCVSVSGPAPGVSIIWKRRSSLWVTKRKSKILQ